ncbi:hypothetical protein CO641_12050 [Lysobacteraceae bacterium NML91-0213]|nr:hypothetical protein CO641_12050 [Xanthomonadaceae bacterium NML91-0213]
MSNTSQVHVGGGGVAVVVPYFNAEEYIARSMSSVLAQNLANLTLIMVDDFSTDGGRVVVDDYARRDPRVISLTSAEKGANCARYRGVASANSEFVMFLDSDDELTPGAIQSLLSLCDSPDIDLVCGNIESVRGSYTEKLYTFRYLDSAVSLDERSDAILDIPPTLCAKLFRRHLFHGHAFKNVPFTQDWNVTYSALRRVNRVRFTEEILYRYIRRDASTCGAKRVMTRDLIASACESWKDVLLQHKAEGDRFKPELSILGIRFFIEMLHRIVMIPDLEVRRACFLVCQEAARSCLEPAGCWHARGSFKEFVRAMAVIVGFNSFTAFETYRVAFMARDARRARSNWV